MPARAKPDSGTTSLDEEKLAQSLIARGLITREEWEHVRDADNVAGRDALLAALVRAECLTASQAGRIILEEANAGPQGIPGYKILEKVGQGSMGTVYKARQISMNRLVAIKVLHPKLASNKDFLERFTREAHLAAKFNSNHVIQAIDVGTAGNLNYFVMEYVEGVTIRDELVKGRVYDEREAVDIVIQVARALQVAHRRNLIHRDIKPANIVLTDDGTAKLADLGMARVTTDEAHAKAEKGVTMGTPHYMAPEQIRGKSDVDSRVDIYALGATLYHMVTGRPPFPYSTVEEVLKAHLKEELTPPDHVNTSLSAGLGEVVEVMMAKKRRKRYPSPDELLGDLECLLRNEPPKFARQNATAPATAAQEEEEDEEEEVELLAQTVPMKWVFVMLAVIAFSCIGNVVLFLKLAMPPP